MPTIDTNGITIAYEESGDPSGRPIVLIMGLGMQLVAWPDAFIQGLERMGRRVIRFDNRDIGLSSKLDETGRVNTKILMLKSFLGMGIRAPYTLDDMADDTIGLMDALGLDEAAILGVSMGGMIAQVLAARFPTRVTHLVSIMSTTGSRAMPAAKIDAIRTIANRPAKGADLEAIIEYRLNVVRVIGSPWFPNDSELVRKRALAALDRSTHLDGMPRQMAAVLASGNRADLLKTIKVPTLVVHGTDDPLVPVEGGLHTAEVIPKASLKIIERMGHDLAPGVIPLILDAIESHLHSEAEETISDARGLPRPVHTP
jgi:pimeloyl-ACP methyl ester carboxylesterase